MWLWISKGMLSVSHLAQRILKVMAYNYCGRQLAQRLGWAAPDYHEKKGATPHTGAYKLSLLYDGRPVERFGVRVETWNFGTLRGKGGEV